MIVSAWKLMRVRQDGTIGPLFINARLRVPMGRWLKAEAHKTKGYAYRPGWHATTRPHAPHLRQGGDRVWVRVSLKGVKKYNRPAVQGGAWLLARWMRADAVTRGQK